MDHRKYNQDEPLRNYTAGELKPVRMLPDTCSNGQK